MMKKCIVFFLLTLALVMTACGTSGNNAESEGDQVYVVNLCYVNSDYLLTGNEELPPIEYYQNHHIYCPKGEQYLALLDVLRGDPFGISGLDTMITDKIKFNSVEVKDGTAFVDIASDGLVGSSLEEGLFISQIVNSLRGSFEEIQQVQFLVDGKVSDTMMGHYDATEPYTAGIYSVGQ